LGKGASGVQSSKEAKSLASFVAHSSTDTFPRMDILLIAASANSKVADGAQRPALFIEGLIKTGVKLQ
jgi:hypothetical protein